MRKALKNNLLEIFKTIYEAHGIVKGFIDKKEFENAQNLLADCQDTAIQIGNLIEESEGEGFVTVSFLEEYCEALYEASINLSESNGYKVQKQLDKKIIKAENSAKNDIKVKLEVVFMPYKASMWDSLESVWKAADEDPDCDAYVVPIPYYDRNPDYSFGEFHYEGGEYPDYVPVVHYESYNLEQRRPDVIYIHNPYDGNNYVTSVDPRFYSSELKKYTDKLVYIPYFVVDDTRSINKLEHYAIAPAVINSDYVIVQSEKVRKKYIEVLLSHCRNTIVAKQFLEAKIQGYGSPKFDKVKNEKLNFQSLPEEWQAIIGDKSKKIIFYNTHLSMFMAPTYEESLIKLKQVLEFFKSRDDVILLWRPHPLTIPTIKSMNPNALDAYVKIVEIYKSEKWGIYDDTPDMERAINLSDAYYGSESSVVSVFRKTGKPILIQNIQCDNTKKCEKFRINPSAFCVVGDDIWMCHSMMNLLIKYNMVSKKTEIIAKLNKENIISGTLISDMFYKNGKLILIPCWAKSIYTYDMKKHTFSEINFEKNELQSGLFIKSFCIEDKIYCIPFHSDELVVVDINTGNVIKSINIRSLINRKYNHINNACIMPNNKIAFVTCDSHIYYFDIETNNIESVFCGDKNSILTALLYGNENLYFVNMNNHTLNKLDYRTNEVSLISTERKHFTIFENGYDIILDFGEEYRVYNINNAMLENIVPRQLSELRNSLSYSYYYSLSQTIDNKNFIFDRCAEILYVIEKDEMTEHYIEVTYDDLKIFAESKSFVESELYGLEELIHESDDTKCCKSMLDEPAGNKIHYFIRSKI